MKKFLIFLILISFFSCKKDVQDFSDFHSNFFELSSKRNHFKDTIRLSFTNEFRPDSTKFKISDKVYKEYFIIDSLNAHLGNNKLEASVFLNGQKYSAVTDLNIYNNQRETQLKYEIQNVYPHNDQLFTEGLFLDGNKIYESSGQYGKSKLVV